MLCGAAWVLLAAALLGRPRGILDSLALDEAVDDDGADVTPPPLRRRYDGVNIFVGAVVDDRACCVTAEEDAKRDFIGPLPAGEGVACMGIRDFGVNAEET